MAHNSSTNMLKVDNVAWMNLLFIFLVLSLHHVNYTQDYLWAATHRLINPYDSGINQILQKLAVGGFLFLSGYKLAISKRLEPTHEFLINRFLRIYPLYFLAVTVFSFTVYPHINQEMPSLGNFIVHALALQSWLPNFYQDNYLTIWFVSNLFFCYLTFVFLRCFLVDNKKFLLAVLTITLIVSLIRSIAFNLYGINIFSGDFDIYFLLFASGMLFSQWHKQNTYTSKSRPLWAVALLLSSLFAFIFINVSPTFSEYVSFVLNRIFVFGFTLPVFYLFLTMSLTINLSHQSVYLVNYIGSASFCIFLFHRPIWTVMYWLYPEKSYLQSLFILGVGIPLIVFISYQIQSLYNARLSLALKRAKKTEL